ncbi:hypothetical protein C8R44DRAFT_773335 [Mycena epipterygia]|nr:hypothetical protein C8R44DRAFT_773335 [Mycena epipterygia]
MLHVMKCVQPKTFSILNSCRPGFNYLSSGLPGNRHSHGLISTPIFSARSADVGAMNISQLLCSQPPSQTSSSSNGGPPASNPQLDDSRSSQGSPTPSSSDAPFKVISTQYRCGNCRQRGHNRKTCPQPEAPKAPPVVTRPRARGCCGLCGEPGHNRTSCRMSGTK